MKTSRKYNCKDVDMLLASKTIVQSLQENLTELSVARNNWTTDYVSSLSAKTDQAMDNYLGLDKKKELREAIRRLAAVQTPAIRDLSFFKTQLEVDFAGEPAKKDSLLNELGFTKNLRNVQFGNQEALIQLLQAFVKGMSGDIRAEIEAKGITATLIDRILTYSAELVAAEVSQETLKATSKEVSEEAVTSFNRIFEEVMGICKIASNYYQYDPLKKEQFTFSKVLANMGTAKKISQHKDEAA